MYIFVHEDFEPIFNAVSASAVVVQRPLINTMKPSKTSKQWMREHINDPFVQLAQKEGYRSRAAYKLLELDKKDRLLVPGQLLVDLGVASGSWL